MLHVHAVTGPIETESELVRKQINCGYMREIFDTIIKIYGDKFKLEENERNASAIGRFFGKILSGYNKKELENETKDAVTKINEILNEKWNFAKMNNEDSLGAVLGYSMFHEGRQCMHTSQLWVIVSFIMGQNMYHDNSKLMFNVLNHLYDSSEELYHLFIQKEDITLEEISLVDKENLFKEFVMFAIGSVIEDSDEILYAMYQTDIEQKDKLIDEFIKLNLYVMEDQKAFEQAKTKEEQTHYWKKLFNDMGEGGAYLGLYILNIVTKKIIGKIPVAGDAINMFVTDPANKYLLNVTKKYYDGKQPQEIEELKMKLNAALKGKTINLVRRDERLYEFVEGNMKCKQCQAGFFDLLQQNYLRDKPDKPDKILI